MAEFSGAEADRNAGLRLLALWTGTPEGILLMDGAASFARIGTLALRLSAAAVTDVLLTVFVGARLLCKSAVLGSNGTCTPLYSL